MTKHIDRHEVHHPKHHTTTPAQRAWVLSFLGGAVLLLGAILFLANGRSRIAFTWTPQPVEGKTTLVAANTPGDNELGAAFVQTSLNVEKTFTVTPDTTETPATPVTPVFTGKARGKATITNQWSQPQPLQAGTRLRSADGLIFRTQVRVDIPVGGSVTTLVVADEQGEKGAKSKGTTFILPGLWAGLQDKITAVAAEDFVGETTTPTKTTKGLSANELANAQAELMAEAITTATPALEKLVPDGRVLYPGMMSATVSKRTGPAIGDAVSTYTLKLTVQATGIALVPQAVTDAAKKMLESTLTSDVQLTELDNTVFTYAVANVDVKKQRADITLTARGTTVPTPTHALLQHVTYSGKTPEAVRALLEKETAVSNIRIELSPFWTRTIPSTKDDLQLEVTRAE